MFVAFVFDMGKTQLLISRSNNNGFLWIVNSKLIDQENHDLIFSRSWKGLFNIEKIKANNSLFINNLGSINILQYTFIKDCRLWCKPIKVLRWHNRSQYQDPIPTNSKLCLEYRKRIFHFYIKQNYLNLKVREWKLSKKK